MRLGVGDGSEDKDDWALFMFQEGNGNGDMKGHNALNLGGETKCSNAGSSWEIWGRKFCNNRCQCENSVKVFHYS